MFDRDKVIKAQAEGVCFICRLCELWYMGDERGLKDPNGHKKCSATNGCGSPLAGKSFHEYKGPLTNRLERYCFMCGAESSIILRPKVHGAQRIGCCDRCVEEMKKHTAGDRGPTVVFVSEDVVGPDKYINEEL